MVSLGHNELSIMLTQHHRFMRVNDECRKECVSHRAMTACVCVNLKQAHMQKRYRQVIISYNILPFIGTRRNFLHFTGQKCIVDNFLEFRICAVQLLKRLTLGPVLLQGSDPVTSLSPSGSAAFN